MIQANTSASASTTNQIRARAAEAENIASLTRLMRGSRSFKIDLDGAEVRRDTVSIAFGSRLFAEAENQKVVQSNARQAASLLQKADAALAEIADRLDQMDTLAGELTDADANFSAQDRAIYQNQLDTLRSEIDTIASETEFNGTKLLQGGATPGQPLSFDIRVSADPGGENISISVGGASVSDLSTNLETATFLSAADTTAAAADINSAIIALDSIRGEVQADARSLATAVRHAEISAAEANAVAAKRSDVQVDIDLARLVGQQIIKEGNVSLTDTDAELLRIGLRNAHTDGPSATAALTPPDNLAAPAANAAAPEFEFPPEPES